MFVCVECGSSYPNPGFCTEDGGVLAAVGADTLLGKTVGSYRIAQKIGEGGMGAVYRAVHPSIGSRVAIKVLSKECAASPALVERFFGEARAVNLIRHERIVSVLDMAALPDGQPYIVMELLEGEALSATLARHNALPLGTVITLFAELLDALSAAHDKGIVHRDLKPDNVFLTKSGHVKVVDFGIAKLRPDMGGLSEATRTGSLMGTPFYMAPEQAAGMPVDHRADLYAAGVILFEVTTGQRPFKVGTLYELLKAHVEQMPPQPSSLRPDIPPPLDDVLLHALQKDANFRYQSAREFAQALSYASSALAPDSFVPVASLISGGSPVAGGARHVPSAPSHPHAVPFGPPTPITLGSTLNETAPTADAPAPKKAGRFGYFAMGTCGLIVLATLGSCVACFGMSLFHEDKSIEVALGDGEVAVIKPGKFDPTAFASRAASAAQKQDTAAKFVGFRASGRFLSGHMDLTRSTTAQVSYAYRTPTGCLEVDVSGTGLSTRRTDKCSTATAPMPRCSLKEVWEGAQDRGAPGPWRDAVLYYFADGQAKGQWRLDVDGGTYTGPDTC